MEAYQPDYRRIVKAARNEQTDYLPLYEHAFSPLVLDQLIGKPVSDLMQGDPRDLKEGFSLACNYLAGIGYDIFPFEGCITELIQGGKGLCGIAPPLFTSRADVKAYPWEEIPDRYFSRFDPSFQALAGALPEGMKAVAGVGNGLFEIVQDFVPMTDLAYLEVDDPGAFALLWEKTGELLLTIWKRFLETRGESYCLFRFGDDLGFKSSLLLKPETIRTHILPQYKRIIDLIHRYDTPFLLHSCGSIFEVMDDLIDFCGIDAKHSNEDSIAPFSEWVERYGGRIGNFGGVDMDVLCSRSEAEIRTYVREVMKPLAGLPGIAVGSGNQIADYVPPEGFLAMVETVREMRGQK
jgi:uroporphyrinogen decarboxylase